MLSCLDRPPVQIDQGVIGVVFAAVTIIPGQLLILFLDVLRRLAVDSLWHEWRLLLFCVSIEPLVLVEI